MSRTTIGAVATAVLSLGLGVVFSAFQAPRWLGFVALVGIGAALIVLLFQLPFVTRRIPWELRRKQAVSDREWFLNLVEWIALRRELQNHQNGLAEKPKPAELRAWAAQVSESLERRGHTNAAKQVEVHLLDDAQPEAVQNRRNELQTVLYRMLVWDEFDNA
jgi:predicted RND superfamily exporter protein